MNNEFKYNYTAPTQKERTMIEHIKKQYEEKSEHSKKMERLRKLDSQVKNPPAIIALVFGIVGVLIFGFGLAMILEWGILLWGIILCVVGCIPMSLAYLIYNIIYQKQKEKYSEQILKLSSELLNENE